MLSGIEYEKRFVTSRPDCHILNDVYCSKQCGLCVFFIVPTMFHVKIHLIFPQCEDMMSHVKKNLSYVHIRKLFWHKIVTIFSPINLNMCFGFSLRQFFLSTHNICFG